MPTWYRLGHRVVDFADNLNLLESVAGVLERTGLPCFLVRWGWLKQEEQAIKSQALINLEYTRVRAAQFKQKYFQRLENLKRNPCAYGSLNVRGLLDMRSHCLKEFDFTDPYSQQKQLENEQALKYLPGQLQKLDAIKDRDELIFELGKGLLAGNMFDWGAKEVAEIMEKGEFKFEDAEDKLQERPWLMDSFDEWKGKLTETQNYKCAAIFCDNSGADIILGVLLFAIDLLKSGTKGHHCRLVFCANTKPTLSDVTYQELMILVKHVAQICPVIGQAVLKGHLVVMESVQGSPCLDLRLIDNDLVQRVKSEGTDLIVIERMGRAIHTNFDAKFNCDSLKVAVLKNRWLDKRLGGEMLSVVFKFEEGKRSPNSTKT